MPEAQRAKLPREILEALEALERLCKRHGAIPPQLAVQASRLLLRDRGIEPDPDFRFLHELRAQEPGKPAESPPEKPAA